MAEVTVNNDRSALDLDAYLFIILNEMRKLIVSVYSFWDKRRDERYLTLRSAS